jgi:hypothetical protein
MPEPCEDLRARHRQGHETTARGSGRATLSLQLGLRAQAGRFAEFDVVSARSLTRA